MKIIKTAAIHNPNIYHNRPVMVMKVDLEESSEISSLSIPGFIKNLTSELPGLQTHTCSLGYAGGFCERLSRGTYLAHIIEHVALEFSTLAGIEVSYGKSRYAGRTGVYNIITRFTNEAGMRKCLEGAFNFVKSLVTGHPFEIAPLLAEIKRLVDRTKMGPSTQAIFDAATKRGIYCQRLNENSLLRLGYGKYLRHVQAAVTDRTSNIAVELVQDKLATKKLLRDAGIPVPEGYTTYSKEGIRQILEELRGPLAVKPVDGHHGKGVSLNLQTQAEVEPAFDLALEYGDEILIEEMCVGHDYRVLVINGKLVAAAERKPPHVVGDGTSTINELIDKINLEPNRAEGHGGLLTKIEIDEVLVSFLTKQNLTLESVIAEGKIIELRENANLSSGGTAKDVTDSVHPTVKSACERIARIVNLDICGIDIIHRDIAQPVEDGMNVIEVNAGPGLRMHLSPSEGAPRDVGRAIVELLYPSGTPIRIPIISVTGTNGKTSTARMLAKICSARPNQCVGLTSTEGIWIGGELIESGDTSGPRSAAKILSDPKVDIAVLEVARGGMMRGGLAYDWSDVAIITNVNPDHIGQDGIEDIEDLIEIKSLIAERVIEGGTLVLNADDKNSLSIRSRPRIKRLERNLMLFSLEAANSALREHLASGGDAAWIENDQICVSLKQKRLCFGAVNEYPVTQDGHAKFQTSNLLASICGALSAGQTAAQIEKALKAFVPGLENPGRTNLYSVNDSIVIVDYAHNPEALKAIGTMLKEYGGYARNIVIGLPGDRTSELLEVSGQIVGEYFDSVILRDELDLRGRKPLEVPGLVENIIRKKYPDVEVTVISDEETAIRTALARAKTREITVICYDDYAAVSNVLRENNPVPIEKIPCLKLPEEVDRNAGLQMRTTQRMSQLSC